MALLDRLAAVDLRLDQILEKASRTAGAIDAAAKSASEAVRSMSASGAQLGEVEVQAEHSRVSLLGAAGEIASTAERASRSMSAAAAEIVQSAEEAEASVKQRVSGLLELIGQISSQGATRLDDLLHKLDRTGSIWDQTLASMIEQVELGQIPLTKLLSLFGQAEIDGQRLIEFLGSMPLDTYTRRIGDFIRDLRDGQADMSEVLELLGKTENIVAKQFLDAIQLFQQGKLTFQAILDLVTKIQQAFPDSQFAELADAIADGIRDGSLG